MSWPGPAPRRPWWRRPAELLRRLFQELLAGSQPRVDTGFARLSQGGYLRSGAPLPPAAAEEIRRRVDELARQQAIDEGSGRVFDPTIYSWVTEWGHRVEAEHDARQSVLQQREELARVEAERLRDQVNQARGELQAIERRLARLTGGEPAGVAGAEADAHPPDPATDERSNE